jgi:hypothetical protein
MKEPIPIRNRSTNFITERRYKDSTKNLHNHSTDKPIFDNQEGARREQRQLEIKLGLSQSNVGRQQERVHILTITQRDGGLPILINHR